VTTTFMGGRRGPPEGDERPLRGLPGGRARPRPLPEDPTPDDDDQPPGNGVRPGPEGAGGVVRPLRPPRVVPGGTAPPLRVIPGGAGRPGAGGAGDGLTPAEVRLAERALPRPQAGTSAGATVGRTRTWRRGVPRRRWVAAILVLVVLVVLVVLAGVAVTGRVVADRPRETTASTAPATTAATATPARPSPVVATIGTGGFSYGMAAGAGALWVVGSDEINRIDPATNTVTASIPVGATGSGPAGVAVGAGTVWVPVAVPGTLWGINPETGRVAARIPLDGPLRGSISVSATHDTVWVACCGESGGGASASGGRLLRVDPRRKRVVADIALPAAPVAVAADASAAWVATAGGQVLMVSERRNRVAATIDAGGPLAFPQTIATGAGGVWLADPFDEQVVRIDPKTRRVMARIPAGAVTTLAMTGDAVWALSSWGLVRIDPATDRVVATASDPDLRGARLVAAGAGAVWTAGWSSVSRIDPDLVTP
jgi:YVTN family beta-propeller protein